jgi:hypothetical protein
MRGFMKYAIEMASGGIYYILSFMKFHTDIQAIIRFCLSNFKGCNVGIIDGWDL